MSATVLENFVRSKIKGAITSSQTSITVAGSTAPFNNVPDPSTVSGAVCYLVLTDNINNPTKFEIISYSTRTASGSDWVLSGVTRGVDSTAAAFADAADVVMSPIKELLQQKVLTTNPDGSLTISSNLGINKTPSAGTALDVSGNIVASGNLTAGNNNVFGDTQTQNLDVMQDLIVAKDVTASGNVNSAQGISATGELSGASAVVSGLASIGSLLVSAAGSDNETVKSIKTGSFTPTLLGATTAGVPNYQAGASGLYYMIGRLMIIQFSMTITGFTSEPAGDLIISGYPSVGTLAGYVGSLQNYSGLVLWSGGLQSNLAATPPISTAIQLSLATIAENTNQGIKIALTSQTNNQGVTGAKNQNHTATRFLQGVDINGDLGAGSENLILSGSIAFVAANPKLT